MAQISPDSTTNDYVYVELDKPSPWWSSLIGVIAIVLIVGVLVAPWAIDWTNDSSNNVANNTLQSSSSVCRPNNAGVPGFFDPTIASWNRFCEWFIEPDVDAP